MSKFKKGDEVVITYHDIDSCFIGERSSVKDLLWISDGRGRYPTGTECYRLVNNIVCTDNEIRKLTKLEKALK